MSELRELSRDQEWQRLDPRMLLVFPLRDLIRFLPALIGLVIAGNASGGIDVRWQLLGIALPVALGLLRYATTGFRIIAGRVELRRGLFDRHVLTTRIERVRTVELTATLFHRVLGLTTVRIGTGTASTSDDESLELDGLPLARARALREELLRASVPARPSHVPSDAAAEAGAVAHPAPPAERVLLVLDPRWARYAPLTTSGVVVGAGIVGAGSQVLDGLGAWDNLEMGLESGQPSAAWWLLVPIFLVAVAVLVSLLSVAGYLMTNWAFTLTRRTSDNSWHLRRGLTTTRETSLDGERVSGVSIGEPIGLRLARGSRLSAIVTGLARGESASSTLVPPAPRVVVDGIAGEVLGTPEPVTAPLRSHGPRARVRRYTRALVPTGLVVAVVAVAAVAGAFGGWTPWLLVACALLLAAAAAVARDRARSLGHTLVVGHFVVRSGSFSRHRHALRTDAIIGWNLRASWFQRRSGLCMLVATTAGGPQSVTAIDVPDPDALDVATAAVPGLVEQFLA